MNLTQDDIYKTNDYIRAVVKARDAMCRSAALFYSGAGMVMESPSEKVKLTEQAMLLFAEECSPAMEDLVKQQSWLTDVFEVKTGNAGMYPRWLVARSYYTTILRTYNAGNPCYYFIFNLTGNIVHTLNNLRIDMNEEIGKEFPEKCRSA